MCACSVAKSSLTLWVTWPVAYHAPLSIGFSQQEYWNGLPFPPPGLLYSTENYIQYLMINYNGKNIEKKCVNMYY